MAPFFSRITGKDRSVSTSTPSPSAAEMFKAQHMLNPESASTSTSSSQISTTTAPKVVLTSASPVVEDSSSAHPPSLVSHSTDSSVKRKQALASIPIPPNTSKLQVDSDLSDVATPTASNTGARYTALPPPELVLQSENEEHHQPSTQLEAQDLPSRRSSLASISLRHKHSKAALKEASSSSAAMPPQNVGNGSSQPSRSRRGSVASSDASLHRNDTLTPSAPGDGGYANPSLNSSVSLARTPSAPASGLLSAPTFDNDNVSIRSASGRKKRLWSNAGNSKKGPAGGIAGALAQSGMSLAGMASPPLPNAPLPNASPPRRAASRGHAPRTSIDSVLHPRRTSVTGGQWHGAHSADEYYPEDSDDVYDSPDALSFEDDEMPVTGFAVASSRRNVDFHELFPDIEEGDYLIEGVQLFPHF